MVSPILPMAGKMDQQQFTQQVIWMGEWTRSPEWAVSRVNSPRSILWLILEGNKQVRIKGMSYCLAPGDLVIIPPHTLHSVAASPDTDCPVLQLALGCDLKSGNDDFFVKFGFPHVTRIESTETLEWLAESWRTLMNSVREYRKLNRMDAKAEAQSVDKGRSIELAYWYSNVQSDFFQLFSLLIHTMRERIVARPTPKDTRVEQACAILSEHLDGKTQISEIASRVFLSESHLRLLFRQTLGISPKSYLRRARMEKARELLSMTDLDLAEISRLLGFENQSRFSREFRQSESVSPKIYRRQWKNF
ncbi:MAG: arabinose operon regulatory protein [Paenibacillaceae bacterium]|jgi:AraC-like DNA-binding protein|nr:arabinose operon regulatory protein [Paenibacillaceae bacterium]